MLSRLDCGLWAPAELRSKEGLPWRPSEAVALNPRCFAKNLTEAAGAVPKGHGLDGMPLAAALASLLLSVSLFA